MSIGFDGFKAFCSTLDGQTLRTLHRNLEFGFSVLPGQNFGFSFTPLSTGKERTIHQKYIQRYVDRFNNNGESFRTVDYSGGLNASYMVTLLKLYKQTWRIQNVSPSLQLLELAVPQMKYDSGEGGAHAH